jgi:Nucleotidyl transferase AbiEii toxin, Type IV TA system
MSEPRYASPRALRRAVTDRLRELAEQRSGARLGDLLRQFAYDRLLARVFTADPDRWVLKGAAAMLARLPAATRHSKDIDLYSQTGDLPEAELALRTAATVDLGDYFRFELGPARPLEQETKAMRVPVTAYLGPTEFASLQYAHDFRLGAPGSHWVLHLLGSGHHRRPPQTASPVSRQRSQSVAAIRRGVRRWPARAPTTRLHTAHSRRSPPGRRWRAGARSHSTTHSPPWCAAW